MDWHITQTGNAARGWTGYTWNRELFPDPPGFIAWLHEQGLKTALNLHPAEGVHPARRRSTRRWRARMGIDPATQASRCPSISPTRPSRRPISRSCTTRWRRTGVDFWWMDWQQGEQTKTGRASTRCGG